MINKGSRTYKSSKNSIIAFLYYVINLLLNFYSRRVFIDVLGTEVLGLNTTANTMLQFLNLTELGIGTAIGFTLYKPLANKDNDTISDIIKLQGYLYKRIAWVIIVTSIVLMCFFPIIFEKIDLPLWYAYASFGVLLFSSILSYFFNYRQILLSANQQDYEILYSYKTIMIIKVIIQIILLLSLKNGYIWWLISETFFAIVATINVTRAVKKHFPNINDCDKSYKDLKKEYSDLTKKIKQLFFHKIGSFAISQCAPIFIYTFASLSVVTYYGNYMIIISGMSSLMIAVFNGLGASIGNLVAEGNEKTIRSVFRELYSLRFWLVASCCFTLFMTSSRFIGLWLGNDFILPSSTVSIIIIILYINLSRYSVDGFVLAYGLCKDIWAPIVEAILNVLLSCVLGYYFGLNGVLVALLITLVIFIKIWKPYFLIHEKLKNFGASYVKDSIIHTLTALFIGIPLYIGLDNLCASIDNTWGSLIAIAFVSFSTFATVELLLLIKFKMGVVMFIERFKNQLFR